MMMTELPVLDGHRSFTNAPLPATPAPSFTARRFALTCSASLAALLIGMTMQPEQAEAACTAAGGIVTVVSGETCVDIRFGSAGVPSGSQLIVQQGGLVNTGGGAAIAASGTGVVVGNITIEGTLRGDRLSPSIGPNTIVFGSGTTSIGQITFASTATVTGGATQQAFNLFTAPLIAGIDTGGTINIDNHGWAIGSATATNFSTVNVTGDVVNRGTATVGIVAANPRHYFDIQQATIGGSVINETTGKLLGAGDLPIRLLGTRVDNNVANKGEIGSAAAAVTVGITIGKGNIDSSIGGSVTNSGSIWSRGTTAADGAGIAIANTAITGSVQNSNAITSIANNADGLRIVDSKVGTEISNTGTIAAVRYGIGLTNVNAAETAPTTVFKNTGTITTSSTATPLVPLTAGLYATGSKLASVSNEGAAAKIENAVTGIALVGTTVSGAVSNDATINATTTGISITASSDVGSVQNKANGTITVTGTTEDGIAILNSKVGSEVSNAGTIAARRYGIGLTNVNAAETAPTTVFKNTGTITSTGTLTAGLYATGSKLASVSNEGATGKIENAVTGIALVGTTVSGAVSNDATINATTTGISIATGSDVGSVQNKANGKITVTGTDGDGINVTSAKVGTEISNAGDIKATRYGIGLSGVTGTAAVSNSKLITSSSGTLQAGIYAAGSSLASVSNAAGGTIENAATGILISQGNVTGAVSNAGTLTATQTGIFILEGTTVGSVANDGTLSAATGEGISIAVSQVGGEVANRGTLTAGGDGIRISDLNSLTPGTSVIGGAVSNSGQLTAGKTGINLLSPVGATTASQAGSVSNTGTIGAVDAGISVSGKWSIAGDVTNGTGGTITVTGATADGIALSGTTVGGKIANDTGATITATRYGIGLTGTGSATSFTNAGEITAGTAGLYAESGWTINGNVSNDTGGSLLGTGDGISLTGTTVTGAVSNAGTIDVDGYGIKLDTLGGPITALINSNTIIADATGIYSTGNAITGDAGNTGAITALGTDADGILLKDTTVGGNIANTAGATITATRYGIGLTGTGSATSFTNAGEITAGTAGLYAEGDWTISGDVANLSGGKLLGTGDGIWLTDTTVTGAIANAGTIDVDGYGMWLETLGGPIKSLVNSGTITADASGIVSTGNVITGDAGNTGTITALGTDADGILLHNTTVGGNLANTAGATITATRYGIGLTGTGSAKSFINRGTITADDAGMYAEAGWTIGEVANLSSNSLLGNGDGIRFTGTTVTGDLTNTGKIDVGGSGVSLTGTTLKGKILNTSTGTVSAGRDGFLLADAGSISLFGNFGTIIGGGSGISSTGSTRIGTLVNAQGVGNTAGGLTYSGNLPTNYHIVIDGQKYGQLFVAPNHHSGVMGFAISDLSQGVVPRTYSTVLTGLTASDLANPDSAVWSFGKLGLLYLRLQMGSQTIWDLVMDYLPDTPNNVDDVQEATNSVFSERRAVMTTAMQYDCDRFDVRGICVELAGRVTDEDGEVTGAAVVNAAVRLAEDVRLGFYLDQQLSQSDKSLHYATARIQQDYNTPLLGAYLGYKANEDGTGLQGRISGGYQAGRLDIRRGEMQYSEEGQDETDITAWYGFGTLGYGFSLGNSLILTPYAGVQYTDVTRDGYGEDWADVTKYPLSYNGYHERAFTAQAGLELSGMFTEETGFEAALGLEYDIDRSANDFSGTSPIPGFESFSFEHDEEDSAKLRPAGMMSLFHDLTPTQRITGTITAGQDVWSENFQGSAVVAYRFAF